MKRTTYIRKEVLVSTDKYENVKIICEESAEFDDTETAEERVRDRLSNRVDDYLRGEIDSIESGVRRAKSKATKYGL